MRLISTNQPTNKCVWVFERPSTPRKKCTFVLDRIMDKLFCMDHRGERVNCGVVVKSEIPFFYWRFTTTCEVALLFLFVFAAGGAIRPNHRSRSLQVASETPLRPNSGVLFVPSCPGQNRWVLMLSPSIYALMTHGIQTDVLTISLTSNCYRVNRPPGTSRTSRTAFLPTCPSTACRQRPLQPSTQPGPRGHVRYSHSIALAWRHARGVD